MSTKETFFAVERFALVGDSRTKKFPALTHKYLQEQGKTVYPVDLAGTVPGFLPSLDEVPDDAEAVIIEVEKNRTDDVVQTALDRGFTRIWLHQMTDTPEAVELCEKSGVELETGGCAVMYNAPTMSPHALHRGIWKLIGRY
jgi:predicted CoA-binding protein